MFQPCLQSLMSAFLVTGEDLQNGTTRHLVTYVLMKPRGSAPLFSPLTRQAPRPSSEPQKLSFVLGHTAKAAEPENQWPRRIITQAVDFSLFTVLSHRKLYCTIPSMSHTQTHTLKERVFVSFYQVSLNNISLLIFIINHYFPSL